MKVIKMAGRDDVATVYIACDDKNRFIEFAQSLTPSLPREKKWVFLISTLYGCPLNCRFCDAGGNFKGKLSKDDILFQIKWLLDRFSADKFKCEKLKIQFARVGEPSLNDDVILALYEIKSLCFNHNLYPSLSTVGLRNRENFYNELLYLKKRLYKNTFQLQFSIHTTDMSIRDSIIGGNKMDFYEIAEYSKKFYDKDGRKITLNFIYSPQFSVSVDIINKYFDKDIFLIKVTPVNPTLNAVVNNIYKNFDYDDNAWFKKLEKDGYEVVISIGELEENKIGSNCGQYISTYLSKRTKNLNSYTYELCDI